MNTRKVFRRTVSAMFIVALLLCNAVTHAEIYTGTGEYIMSEGENLGVAKERAKSDAMRNACEQAGVYVKSYSLMKNFKLEADVIETMTSNIIKLVEEPYFYPPEIVGNLEGFRIRVTIKAYIDDSDINRWLNKDSQEVSTLVAQNEALRKANEEQERQIAKLKRQLAQATTQQDKERIAKEFVTEDNKFLSNQKVDEAWKLYDKGDYNGAISLHNEALKLNPNNALAYYGRGTAYLNLKQYEQAIQGFNKAIKLNPNYADAYNNRGLAYYNLGQNELAIQDYDKAIELNPNDEAAYTNRGNAYAVLEQYERAIQDYNKALALNPKLAEAYNNRGIAYKNLGQCERAIQDYNKALALNPKLAEAYNNRAVAYAMLGNFKQAIADATKAIQLNPNLANAYYIRGLCYQKLGEEAKAQKDFAKAKQLGYNG